MIQQNKKGMAVMQVAILIVSIFAIGYILSGQIGIVSAESSMAYCGGDSVGFIQEEYDDSWEDQKEMLGSAPSCSQIWAIFIQINPEAIEVGIGEGTDALCGENMNNMGEIHEDHVEGWNNYVNNRLSTPYTCDDLWSEFLYLNPLAEGDEDDTPIEIENLDPEFQTYYCGGQQLNVDSFYVDSWDAWRTIRLEDGASCLDAWTEFVNANPNADYQATTVRGAGYVPFITTPAKTFDTLNNPTIDNSVEEIEGRIVEHNGITYTWSSERGCFEDSEEICLRETPSGLWFIDQDDDGAYDVNHDQSLDYSFNEKAREALSPAFETAGLIASIKGAWNEFAGLFKKGKAAETVKDGVAGGAAIDGKGVSIGEKFAAKLGVAGEGKAFALNVLKQAGIAAAIYAGLRYGLPAISGITSDEAEAIALGFSLGYFVGSVGTSVLGSVAAQAGWAIAGTAWVPVIGWGVGIALGVGIIISKLWKKEGTNQVVFSCQTWQPPQGGEYCEECNDFGILGCTEYQCKSLGLGCELVNVGTSDQKCTWTSEDDFLPPAITPRLDSLTYGYEYRPLSDNRYPSNTGVAVYYNGSEDGCSPAFKNFQFGVELDKLGSCKIDTTRNAFDDMLVGFGGSSSFKYNHSQNMMFPGVANLEQSGFQVSNGNEYSFYARCKSANGFANTADYQFNFCIQDGPDLTPPEIYETNRINGGYVPHNLSELDINVYVNEPSECKWDHVDKNYEDMANEMVNCVEDIGGSVYYGGRETYPCETTLTGLQDNSENNFYFRCKDQPKLNGTNESQRQTMPYSYVFSLLGSETIGISSAGPDNETITASNSPVKVILTATTEQGAEDGKAWCYSSYNGEAENNAIFDNTEHYSHSTELWLNPGQYNYHIQCNDIAGNFDSTTVNFSVESDETSSIVVRAYKDDPYLKIITNEAAGCVYNLHPEIQCGYSFNEGIAMTNLTSGLEHYVTWQAGSTFYIKCKDRFGNGPGYDACNVIVKPFDI